MCFGLSVFLNYPCVSLPNLTPDNQEYTVIPNLQMPSYCAQGQRQYCIALISNTVLEKKKNLHPVTYPACRENPLSTQQFTAISVEIG